MITLHTSDISNLCEYEWYQWVMFHYQSITYPYSPVALGQYLGTATDVVSTTTYKILKGNGKNICRTTFRSLIIAEIDSPEHKEQQKDFDA